MDNSKDWGEFLEGIKAAQQTRTYWRTDSPDK